MIDAGTTLVGRYELTAPLAPELSMAPAWAATDHVLDRTVRVVLPEGEHVAAALDAARRAALVTDPRLTRVLDVGVERVSSPTGPDRDVSYIITEAYDGRSLTDLTSAGPLEAAQARAVVGEAAAALESARRRGLHHGALRPEAIRINGSKVTVTGLGIDGPVSGIDERDGDAAALADASGLVALLYFALTGHWPNADLEAHWLADSAARPVPVTLVGGGPLPASELVPGLSADLAAICASALTPGSSVGPHTPGEVVAALEPWGMVSLSHPVERVSALHSGGATRAGATDTAPSTAVADVQPIPYERTPAPEQRVAVPADPRWNRPMEPAAPGVLPAAVVGARSEAAAPSADHHTFEPTKAVLLLFVVAVVVAAVAAVAGITHNFHPALVYSGAGSTFGPTSGPTTAATSGSTSQPTQPPQDIRPVIASGAQVDPPPQGDNGEHPEAVDRAFDGDLTTYWMSRTYQTAQFSGLKSGIGYAITLKQAASVSTIILDTNNKGGHIEVRATTKDDPTSGPILASGAFSADATLKFSKPVTSKYFVLWFTELPTNPDGQFRIELNEIQMS